MTEENAFMAEILSAPDDDLPRLVYADWLDDHGQAARAAFIRVQCELAKLPHLLLLGSPVALCGFSRKVRSHWVMPRTPRTLCSTCEELRAAGGHTIFVKPEREPRPKKPGSWTWTPPTKPTEESR